ncbi:hypothetical protein SAMN05216353_1254 [Halobacillus alkaliphilus]|uniref:Uncharacterized protein n=1 Tax=Halobacillus alkaliphilus TaxID=396056 RepID=A0A1I2PEJ4_9BACI|nr:hypothetical protein [Halobacillus alkaliphilus]SFG14565.1 hypothetical protein SAMN05216353_1254 [Halobacillus alkaliphilus]
MNIVKILFAVLTATYFLGLSPAVSLQAHVNIEQKDSLVANFTDMEQGALAVSRVLLPKGKADYALPPFLFPPAELDVKGLFSASTCTLEPLADSSGFFTLEQFHSNYL